MNKSLSRILPFIIILFSIQSYAIDLYWVGGTGTWNDANNWSFNSGGAPGAGIPIGADNIFFDAFSFSAGSQVVTVDGDIFFNNMDWSGVTNSPRMEGGSAFTAFVDGSLTFSTDMLHAFSGTYTFRGNNPGNTITSAGQTFLDEIIFQGLGEWTLLDPLKVFLAIQMNEGSFISNNQDIDVFTFFSTSQLARNIDLGTSNVIISQRSPGNGSALILGGDNLTWSGGNATFEFRGTSSLLDLTGDTSFDFGTLTFFSDNSTIRSSTMMPPDISALQFMFNGEIIGNLKIGDWTLTMGQTVFLSNGSRQIVDDIITGNDCDGLASLIVRDNTGANATLQFTVTPTSLAGLFLKGVEADSPDGRTILLFGSQDGGNNGALWVFQNLNSRDLYWVGGTGDWNNRNNWSLASGGPGNACIPKPNDNIFFDNNSFNNPNDVVSGITPGFVNNLTFDASNYNNVTLDIPELYINNDLTLTTILNWQVPTVYLVGNDEAGGSANTDFQIINTGLNTLINLISQSSRKIELASDLTLSGDLIISTSVDNNTFNTQGFNLTAQTLRAENSPVRLIFGTSTITITGPRMGLSMPVTITQINMVEGTASTWLFTAEDSGIEANVGFFGDLIFQGETGLAIILMKLLSTTESITFLSDGELKGDQSRGVGTSFLTLSAGHTYVFESGFDHFIGDIEAIGNICSPITIISDQVGNQASLIFEFDTDSLLNMEFVEIKDLIAIDNSQRQGSTNFIQNYEVGNGSTNLGNTSGWAFPSEEENLGAQQFLGADIDVCSDETITLEPFDIGDITRIVWLNDSTENLTYQIPASDENPIIATAFFPDGCSLTDTIEINFQDTFVIDLGQDTTICEGESLILGTNISGASYTWTSGDTTAFIIPDLATSYEVVVTRGACIKMDNIDIDIIDIEDFTLGPDTTLCDGNAITLNAPPITFGTYTWSDGSNVSSLSVSNNAVVWVEVAQDRCTLRDSVIIDFDPDFVIDLGRDTTICEGEAITLSGPMGLDNYNWSNGDTTSSITVGNADNFSLTASRGACNQNAIVQIDVSQIASFSIGQDITRCDGDTVGITIPVGIILPTFWSDGSNNSNFDITSSGTYWLEVQDGNCTRRDSLEAVFQVPFSLDLGNDTTLCKNETLQLTTQYSDGDFSWSDGSSDQTLNINSPDNYNLSLTRGACTVIDAIDINYVILDDIDLGADRTLCEGESVELLATDIPNANIMWQDGNTDSVRTATTSDFYFVQVVVEGCATVGSVNLEFNPAINLNLGADQTACAGDTILLDASSTNANNYTWNTGVLVDNLIILNSGTYILTADRGACTETDTVEITYLNLDALNLGEDIISCGGDVVTLDATLPGIMAYNWIDINNNTPVSTDPIIGISTNGNYAVTAASQGCSTGDTINVVFDTPIAFTSLGADTTLCQGDSISFSLVFNDVDVFWSDGTIDPDYTISTDGTYSVLLERGGCTENDTININTRALPVLNLDDELSACNGTRITLDGTTPNVNFNWSTGESTAMIDVSTPGIYTLIVTDEQCTNEDSTNVTFVEPPVFMLRQDTTVCDGTPVTLDPGLSATDGFSYTWSTGVSTQSIEASNAGQYKITVSNNDNCTTIDSFTLAVDMTPIFQLPETAGACEGMNVPLEVVVTSDQFMWSTGEVTPRINISTSAIVWAEAAIGNCVFRDSTEVIITPIPIVVLPSDTTLCEGDMLMLDSGVPNGSYNWSNGDSLQTITISNEGNYSVIVNVNDCEASDDISISINPRPTVDLGTDQTICDGATTTLDASGGNWTTLWSTGATSSSINVDQTGQYMVVADLNGCTQEAEINVTVESLPSFDLGEDISRCDQISATLEVLGTNADIVWNTGDIGPSLIVNQAGTYTATAMTAAGCTFVDNIVISDRDCQKFSLYVPNAFAPNSELGNDEFFVTPADNAIIISYEIQIFDRWGNDMFTSLDINAKWNGRSPDYSFQSGVYTYLINVRYSDDFEADRQELITGSFTLIR